MVLAVAVLLIVGAISFTLLVPRVETSEEPLSSTEEYLRRKQSQIEESLADLQFEFRVGKLSEPDYRTTEIELSNDLANITAQIDRLAGAGARADKQQPTAEAAPAPTGKRCPHCGATFDQELKFCGECGKPMGGGPA